MLFFVCIVSVLLTLIPNYIKPFCNYNIDILNTIATVVSIILAVVSIIYTFISGNQTLQDLKKIQDDNKCLVEEIKKLKGEHNYNKENTEAAFRAKL